jgi:hypothetical protein
MVLKGSYSAHELELDWSGGSLDHNKKREDIEQLQSRKE